MASAFSNLVRAVQNTRFRATASPASSTTASGYFKLRLRKFGVDDRAVPEPTAVLDPRDVILGSMGYRCGVVRSER